MITASPSEEEEAEGEGKMDREDRMMHSWVRVGGRSWGAGTGGDIAGREVGWEDKRVQEEENGVKWNCRREVGRRGKR